jgi:hypothetical protein
MPRQRSPIQPARSKKAGRPPESRPETPRVRRRQKTAKETVRKDSMVIQSTYEPRARWPAAKPKFKKR